MAKRGSNMFLVGLVLTGLVSLVLLACSFWPGAIAADGLFNLALTPETLSVLLSGLLAVLFDWCPGLAPWFGGLSRLKKQQVMIALLLALVAGVFAGSCYGLFETGLACARQSLPQLLEYVLAAAGANQAVHLLARPSRS